MKRLIIQWLLKFVIAPVAVIVLAVLVLGFLAGCAATSYDRVNGCERIKVKGQAGVIMAYRKDDDWYFATPIKISPKTVVTAEPGVSLVAALFDDGHGIKSWLADSFYSNTPEKRFCVD